MWENILKCKTKTEQVELCLFLMLDVGVPNSVVGKLKNYHITWILETLQNKEYRDDVRTAKLQSLIANCNRGKNTKPFTPCDFLPQKPKTDFEMEQEFLKSF
jgi:hypothetical protein